MNLLYAVLIAVIGLAAIVLEMFVPAAGLIGLVGLGCIVAGVTLSFIHYGALTGIIFLSAVIIIVPGVIIFWFKRFPRSLMGKALILFNPGEKPGETAVEKPENSPLMGLSGTVLTDLRPSGTVLVDGKKYSAVTAGEYILRNKKVRITKVNGNRIEVREEE